MEIKIPTDQEWFKVDINSNTWLPTKIQPVTKLDLEENLQARAEVYDDEQFTQFEVVPTVFTGTNPFEMNIFIGDSRSISGISIKKGSNSAQHPNRMRIQWMKEGEPGDDVTINDLPLEFGDNTEIGFVLPTMSDKDQYAFFFENTDSGSSHLEVGEISFWTKKSYHEFGLRLVDNPCRP